MSTLLLLTLACGGLNRGKSEPTSAPAETNAAKQPLSDAAAGGGAGIDLASFLGVNEAVTVPPPFLKRKGFGPEQLQEELDRDARMTDELGAQRIRGHSGTFPFLNHQAWSRDPQTHQEYADRWVRTVLAQGFDPVVMLSPWPGNYTQRSTKEYLPPDEAAYTAWVREVVERYDGDGVDDMPGLTRGIHNWEVDNEPDLKANPPKPEIAKGMSTSFCPPSEYAKVLIMTSAAVREADAQAVILGGGFYRPHTDSGRDYMAKVFQSPQAKAAIDVLSLHVYATEQGTGRFERALKYAGEIVPGKPVWITETNQPAREEGKAWVTPNWQAAMMTQMVGVALREGVEGFFWHTLADAPPNSKKGPGMKEHSFYTQPKPGDYRAKPVVGSYQRLSERFEALGTVQVIGVDGGVQFGDKGPRLIWSGSAEGKATNLVTGEVTTGRVTADSENSYWVE